MKILLKEKDGKIWALDPNTGEKLDRIMRPNMPGVGEYSRSGFWWDSWKEARERLHKHEIIIGDDPTETPVIFGRASFNPVDMVARDMTIRQVYKCSAMQQLITAQLDTYDKKDNPSVILAKAAGRVADAMIAEDRRHEESK